MHGDRPESQPIERGIFANRTLNLRAIRAIGYDMDYTLIHYHAARWEQRAYDHVQQRLAERGWPVDGLRFDAARMIRGLVFDTELGNIVKANRFGFVNQACHGTRALPYEELRTTYRRTIVDLDDPRFVFANTLFSLSKGWMYAQLVDLLDAGRLPRQVRGYNELFGVVKRTLDEMHVEGELKAEIVAHPERFVDLDPQMPQTLLDQRQAGKMLLLITNAEWSYVRPLMSFACDRFLPAGMTWRSLFDIVIVGARKPDFFSAEGPLFEVVDEDRGLLQPAVRGLHQGAFLGGNAQLVERHLGLAGDEILYVGDHLYGDVEVSKKVLRWRTALVLRELEAEMSALEAFSSQQAQLSRMMRAKERLEAAYCQVRLSLQRASCAADHGDDLRPQRAERQRLKDELVALDQQIAPLARASSELANEHWGLLLRAGNDKSQLARQVENYADVYTSRVSNFLCRTPFVYLRGPHGALPHDVARLTDPAV